MLDFAVQRSRIAVKNPRVRPPKNPRSLLHMPSEEPTPTPTPSSRLPVKLPGGVPLGGIGIGIKLPGRSLMIHESQYLSLDSLLRLSLVFISCYFHNFQIISHVCFS